MDNPHPIVDDPIRQYTEEEVELLNRNLARLTQRTLAGDFADLPVGTELIATMHRELFVDVRDHGGRMRSANFGTDRLTFGPNRSLGRHDVPSAMQYLVDQASLSIRSILANAEDEYYEHSSYHTAVWAHAEMVRVHPFEDGNGRTSRVLMTEILRRLDFGPVAVEVVKDDYNKALNVYHRERDIGPILDLVIRLAAEQASG